MNDSRIPPYPAVSVWSTQSTSAYGAPYLSHGLPQCTRPPRNSNAIVWLCASTYPRTSWYGVTPANGPAVDVDLRLGVARAALAEGEREPVGAAGPQPLAGVGEREPCADLAHRPLGRGAGRGGEPAGGDELPALGVEEVGAERGRLEVDGVAGEAVAAVRHRVAGLRHLGALDQRHLGELRVGSAALGGDVRRGPGALGRGRRVLGVAAHLAGAGNQVLGGRVVVGVRRGAGRVLVGHAERGLARLVGLTEAGGAVTRSGGRDRERGRHDRGSHGSRPDQPAP